MPTYQGPSPQDYRSGGVDKKGGNDDTLLDRQLRAMWRVLGRRAGYGEIGFDLDDEVTTRLYGRDDEIAPIATTSGLIVKAASGRPITWADVTALTLDTDFELLPRNAMADGLPFTELRVFGWGDLQPTTFTPKTYFPEDYRVQVAARHGWLTAPHEIWWGCIVAVSMVRVESPFATGSVQEMEQAVDASPQARKYVKDLTQSLRRYPIGIG